MGRLSRLAAYQTTLAPCFFATAATAAGPALFRAFALPGSDSQPSTNVHPAQIHTTVG